MVLFHWLGVTCAGVTCAGIDVALGVVTWVRLRRGTARMGGLSITLPFSLIGAVWTASSLFAPYSREHLLLALGWPALLSCGFWSLSREDTGAVRRGDESDTGAA